MGLGVGLRPPRSCLPGGTASQEGPQGSLALSPPSAAIFPPLPDGVRTPGRQFPRGFPPDCSSVCSWLHLKDFLPLSQNTKIPLDVPQRWLSREALEPSVEQGGGGGP